MKREDPKAGRSVHATTLCHIALHSPVYRNMEVPGPAVMPANRPQLGRSGACQVAVDVPRTAPDVPFFAQPAIQKSLERILYLWGIRCRPGSDHGLQQ